MMTMKPTLLLLVCRIIVGHRHDAAFAFTTTRPSSSSYSCRSCSSIVGHSSVSSLRAASPLVQEEQKPIVQAVEPRQLDNDDNNAMEIIADAEASPAAGAIPSASEPFSPLAAVSAAVFGTDQNAGSGEYQRGLITIGFITLLFSSNSPVLHAAFHSSANGAAGPPCLLLNAAVSAVALVGLLVGGEALEANTDLPSSLQQQPSVATTESLGGGGVQDPQGRFLEEPQQPQTLLPLTPQDRLNLQAGGELGLWKFLGTTANIYGLSLTTAAHGAFLIQLTTLIVPVVQGILGVPIPKRIQFSVVLALAGVVCFTQDPTGTPSMVGDGLCVLAAVFYATYDLRLFSWGKQVAPRRLITGKIATQAMLSLGLLLTAGSTSGLFGGASTDSATSDLSAWQETLQYLSSNPQWAVLIPVVLWSGVVVNALAPFLQVGGQQAVGPTRCQTIYASQPLWAAIMGFVVFGDTIGWQGVVGGSAFLTALFLAATAEAPDPDCGKTQCEV